MDPDEKYEALKLENQLCFPLYACSRKIVNQYTPHLKKWGLTYTQYLVFLVLWDGDAIPVGDLCRKLYLDSGTLTPLLKNLEKAGWVTRQRWKEDERVVLISLTEKGWALRDALSGLPRCIGESVPLSLDEAKTFYALLYKILNPDALSGEPEAYKP